MRRSRQASLAVLVLASWAVPATAQAAPAIECGTVLTTNTTLTADLIGCSGDGLVIGAAGITIDLAGHTVAGDGVPNTNGFDAGIRDTGFADITVTGGAVSGFDRGVWLTSAAHSRVAGMTVHGQGNRGIMIEASDASQVVADSAYDNGASGIAIVDSQGVEVTQNRSHANPTGVRLQGSSGALVTGNTLYGNDNAVQVVDGATGNTISRNRLDDATGAAVEMQFSNYNTISSNVSSGANGGIILEAADDNVITDNQQLNGIGPDGIGIQIYGNRNLVARNTVVNFIRYGIEVDDFQDPGHSPTVDNIIRDNVVKNGVEGIAVGPEAGGVVLRTNLSHNVVSGATDDGIQALGPSTGLQTTKLTGNMPPTTATTASPSCPAPSMAEITSPMGTATPASAWASAADRS